MFTRRPSSRRIATWETSGLSAAFTPGCIGLSRTFAWTSCGEERAAGKTRPRCLDASGDEMDLMANITDDRAMANPGRELDRKVMSERISEALSKLTPRERTVFELKHYQGLKLRTIGEMLSTTEETAKNTLFRATRKLRANLAELR